MELIPFGTSLLKINIK